MKKMPKTILLGRFKEYMLDFEHVNLDKIFTRNLIHICVSHDLFENANRALDYLASETAYYNTNSLDENYRAVIEDLAKEVTRLKKLASRIADALLLVSQVFMGGSEFVVKPETLEDAQIMVTHLNITEAAIDKLYILHDILRDGLTDMNNL